LRSATLLKLISLKNLRDKIDRAQKINAMLFARCSIVSATQHASFMLYCASMCVVCIRVAIDSQFHFPRDAMRADDSMSLDCEIFCTAITHFRPSARRVKPAYIHAIECENRFAPAADFANGATAATSLRAATNPSGLFNRAA
jgi:hypothetical protein